MKATAAWSVKGHRVEYFAAGIRSAYLAIDGERTASPLWIDGSEYRLRFSPGRTGPIIDLVEDSIDLVEGGGHLIPRTEQHVAPIAPPSGASCATHPDAPARIACGRCGSFSCSACTYLDDTHCRPCAEVLLAAEAKKSSNAVYWVPGLAYLFPFGGCFGLMIGAAMGFVVVAIANRIEDPKRRLGICAGIHAAAWLATNAFFFAVWDQSGFWRD